MKLSYFQILSQHPIDIEIGHIKPITIGTIRHIGEDIYKSLLFYAVLNVNKFYKNFIPDRYNEYLSSSKEEQDAVSLFDLVCGVDDIIADYEYVFNLFFVEDIKFSIRDKRFNIIEKTNEADQDGEVHHVINENNFDEVINIIAQLCNMENSSAQDEYSNIKDKATRDLYAQIENARRKRRSKKAVKKEDPMYNIGNMISVVSAYGNNGLNCLDIDNVTIANLYDQFIRIIIDRQYHISARNVSVWGDSDKKFKGDSYLKNLNET